MSKPTPTTHGAWRVIDGQLVNEAAGLPPAASVERLGGPGIPVPPVDAPNTPQTTPPRTKRERAGTAATTSNEE